MTTQEITQRNHHRAVRFFWGLLIGATMVSLVGNIAHAVIPYIPCIAIQIGAAAVPPIALLAAVHGIALAVRAGSVRAGLLLGGHRCCRYWRRRVRRELPGAARPDASPWVQQRNCMDVPRDHRHGSGRQHHDAGCTRGQTRTPRSHGGHVRQYTNTKDATVGATSEAERKSRGHTVCTEQ